MLQELKQDGRRGCGLGISLFGSGKGRAGAIGREASTFLSWREKPRVLLRRRGWACGEVTPPSRRAQKQIAKYQPVNPLKIMGKSTDNAVPIQTVLNHSSFSSWQSEWSSVSDTG